jgi:hypothetical protein
MSKRHWFQIHLSTAIVLMFAAGGLLWANCIKVEVNVPSDIPIYGAIAYGWPCWVFLKRRGKLAGVNMDGEWWFGSGILANVAVVAAILFVLAFVLEAIFDRREAKKR